jgi:hypothetical protein
VAVRDLDITILMPCLDESATVGRCVATARTWLDGSGLSGEVLVADNGSTDGSQQSAIDAGARVVSVPVRGYGAALQTGIEEARGRWVVMGDADASYDFSDLAGFVRELEAGADIVVGNRFEGGIAPGAMPWLHRYLGNPVLSLLGRAMFRIPVRDFHCGLRAGVSDRLQELDLVTPGMEYASEMIVRAALASYRIAEVPTTLSPDGRDRAPHLRTWSDGWRHLRFMLLFSPGWMFLAPGMALAGLGLVLTVLLAMGDVTLGGTGGPTFSGTTLVGAATMVLVGFQLVTFDLISTMVAVNGGLRPPRRVFSGIAERFRLERGLALGAVLMMIGVSLGLVSLWRWSGADWGDLEPVEQLRVAVPAGLFTTLGVSVVFTSLLLSAIGLDRRFAFTRRG